MSFHDRLRLEHEERELLQKLHETWTTLPKQTRTDIALHQAGCQLQLRNPEMRALTTQEVIIQILSRITEMTYEDEKVFSRVWNLDGAARYVMYRWNDTPLVKSREKKVIPRSSERRAWWKLKRREEV